jgi:hypothetical protein
MGISELLLKVPITGNKKQAVSPSFQQQGPKIKNVKYKRFIDKNVIFKFCYQFKI